MRKPGTDENNVQMSDVLCDFCHAAWVDQMPMIEGHQGSCICGNCLSVAYTELVLNKAAADARPFKCPMCLEGPSDRAALGRGEEPGWRSPLNPEAVICRRCAKLAAGALHKDKDFAWSKPE